MFAHAFHASLRRSRRENWFGCACDEGIFWPLQHRYYHSRWYSETNKEHLHIVQLRYCEGSFFRVNCVLSRRYQQILEKIWNRNRCCPSIRPIPSHVHQLLVPYCLFAANVTDDCSRTCTIRLIPRCMPARSNVLRRHLLLHRWKPFLDNLFTKYDAKKECE